PVVDGEAAADDEDRRHPSEALEQAVAEPPEEQLLDERRDGADHEEVGRERRRVVGLPARRREPLLAPAVEERVDRRDRAVDDEQEEEPEPEGALPRPRPPEREQPALAARDRERDGGDDPEDDQLVRRRRPAVEDVAIRRPGGEAARVRDPGDRRHEEDPRDEAPAHG